MDSMKLATAALTAYARGNDHRHTWGPLALRALDLAEQTGRIEVDLPDLEPDVLLRQLLIGPPAARRDGPWSETEAHLLALVRLGLREAQRLDAAGAGTAAAQVGALLLPLPAFLRGGQRRPFDPRIFRQHVRQAVLPAHLLSDGFRALLEGSAAVRPPLPDRLR